MAAVLDGKRIVGMFVKGHLAPTYVVVSSEEELPTDSVDGTIGVVGVSYTRINGEWVMTGAPSNAFLTSDNLIFVTSDGNRFIALEE